MRFSDQFGVVKTGGDDWFDPVLSVDTGLFLDPFLVYANERGDFVGSHAEIIRFFNDVFSDIARTKGDTTHLLWRRSLSLLVFPEVDELCLGYAAATTRGAGSGRGFADAIAASLGSGKRRYKDTLALRGGRYPAARNRPRQNK